MPVDDEPPPHADRASAAKAQSVSKRKKSSNLDSIEHIKGRAPNATHPRCQGSAIKVKVRTLLRGLGYGGGVRAGEGTRLGLTCDPRGASGVVKLSSRGTRYSRQFGLYLLPNEPQA